MINAYSIMLSMIIIISFFIDSRRDNLYIYLACFFMFAVMGLRDASVIGIDSTSSYLHLFQRMSGETYVSILSHEDAYNSLFPLLMKFVYDLSGGNYQVFIGLVSAFVIISVGHLIKEFSPFPMLSVLLYLGLIYYFTMFDELKQALAMSLLVYAFDAVADGKPVRFLILSYLASMFHHPALIFMPVYLFARIRVRRDQYAVVIAAVFGLVYYFRTQLIALMLENYYYSPETAKTIASQDVSFFGGSVFVYVLIILIGLVLRPPHQKEDFIYTTLLKCMILASVLQTFCYYNNIFKRLADYYAFFGIILIPMIVDDAYNSCELFSPLTAARLKNYGRYAFGGYGAYYFLNYLNHHRSVFLPFRFFFQK